MLEHFFQLGPVPVNEMTGTYDFRLVALSYLVAVFASYIALDFTGRLRDPSNTSSSSKLWFIGGSIAMGAGIWSMHFIGMLSFTMPHMTMNYEPYWTAISLMVAICASGFALFLLKTKIINVTKLALGGIILGLAIASMHYTGMEAMRIDMDIHYLPGLFFLSIVIAILASEAALWLALKSNQVVARIRVRLKLISAIIMGLAICGMHYTGMSAAIFTHKEAALSVASIDPTIMSMSIAAVTFGILGIAFFASSYKEATSQQQIEAARQLGMAEVAASVLHNVGNVLNSVNVSANLVAEKIQHSQLASLSDISNIMNEHKNDIGKFMEHDVNGQKIPLYLTKLSEHWKEEQINITSELTSLLKYIQHIRDIISVQQGISRTTTIEQLTPMDEVVNETLLLTGLDSEQKEITIIKKFEKTSPIILDKVKLLQVLVNLLTNAKESLRDSTQGEKILTISLIQKTQDKVIISISDNGIGIARENITKIFAYGFTTKQSGHGFGLHNCAISINEMGGSIQVVSNGLGQGATFIIELPSYEQTLFPHSKKKNTESTI